MKQRVYYMDWLRVIATIMVVSIHVSAWLVGTHLDKTPLSHWMTGNVFESISRASVPLFVMISGALLLGDKRDLSYKEFLQKRISKIAIPLLGWSLIYYSYLVYRGDYFDGFSVKQFLELLITNGISTHLWFMYMILGIYLTTPLIKVFVKGASKKDLKYYLLLWLFASVVVKFIKYHFGLGLNLELFFVTNYVGYFILGYYLANLPLTTKAKYISLVLSVVGILTTFLLTYFDTKRNGGALEEFWYEYYSPNVVVASIGIFLFFRVIVTRTTELPFLFRVLNKVSFGIYLAHILVMQVLSNEIFNPIWNHFHPAIATTVNVMIVITLSGFGSYVLSKVPVLKKLVP
ncbi:acyltransferase family protein [Neobacillus sp. PS2-9]|uniref:acyltransferase n=1 Tax=Neobacillus sp. PS2-9 TaxID=3070676 RepID=UPI0027E1FF93|nr:acyltransferase family protein [Neobacillus sp. PS2-9]WML58967.1 acyltransferase family protein [Neobacillus sp. PS2-9]